MCLDSTGAVWNCANCNFGLFLSIVYPTLVLCYTRILKMWQRVQPQLFLEPAARVLIIMCRWFWLIDGFKICYVLFIPICMIICVGLLFRVKSIAGFKER